jgi:putative flippase GtrA
MAIKREGAAMSAAEPTAGGAEPQLTRQIPSFAAIGLLGYFVDSGVTYLCAKHLGMSPELARPPGFIVATIVNFALNRAITFRHADAPLIRAFLRYWVVAGAGLAINYAVYSACVQASPLVGVAVTPGVLPLFIAAGTGVAMVVTFVGFRFFAFRP